MDMLFERLPLRERPRQMRARERVLGILDAASTVVREHGVAALTVSAVAQRAEMPIGTVYRYFRDLDAIVQGVVIRDRVEMDAILMAEAGGLDLLGWREQVRRLIRRGVDIARERPGYLALRSLAASHEPARVAFSVADWVRTLVDSPAFRAAGIDPELAVRAASVGFGAVQGCMPSLYACPADEVDAWVDELTRLIERYAEDVAGRMGLPLP